MAKFDKIADDEITPEMLLLQDDESEETQDLRLKKSVSPSDHTRSKKFRKKKNKTHSREMSSEEVFALALRDFRNRNFPGVVRYLTPFVEDQPFHLLAHKLLAYAFIETGYPKDAERVVNRILSFNRNDAESLNMRAYLELQSGELEPAINDLLDALYLEEDHPLLKRNLEKIRSLKDVKLISALLKPREFIEIQLPEETCLERMNLMANRFFSSPFLKFLVLIFIFGLFALIFYVNYPAFSNWVSNYRMKRGLAVREFKRISIKGIDQLVAERKPDKLYFTAEEVKKKFYLLRLHLKKRHYNRSRLIMNELLYSNASEKVKEHVLILESFLPDANLQNLDFVPSYRDIVRAPMIYKGVLIRWSGTIANLQHIKREETTFDLLINFVDEALVEGIAEAHFKGFVHLINGEKTTLFGEVAGLTVANKVIIKGRQVLRLGKK